VDQLHKLGHSWIPQFQLFDWNREETVSLGDTVIDPIQFSISR
jgi:hypothetical protein